MKKPCTRRSRKEPDTPSSASASVSSIQVRGAGAQPAERRCRPARDRLVVLTGVSGSGKSSLAFDTIYAEGQRRYLECLSTYARQFLDQLERPDVNAIEGLPPTVAIDQKAGAPTRGARSARSRRSTTTSASCSPGRARRIARAATRRSVARPRSRWPTSCWPCRRVGRSSSWPRWSATARGSTSTSSRRSGAPG